MNKEKESLLKKALKILTPSLFAIAVMVASFGCFSIVTNASELVSVVEPTPLQDIYLNIHVTCSAYKGGAHNTPSYGSECWIDDDNDFTGVIGGGTTVYAWVFDGEWFIMHAFDTANPSKGVYNATYYSTSWKKAYHSLTLVGYESNLPIFDSAESMLAYCTTGDDSGQLNKPEIVDDPSEFALLNFKIDNTIHATWGGIICDTSYNYSDIYIEVKPTYFVMLEKDEEYQTFQGVGTIEIPYDDFEFSKPYEDYFADNPYIGRCQLILKFTPIRKPANATTWEKGQPILVTFDESGNIKDSVIPETALTPQYDSECKLIVPYCNYNPNNFSHYIGWESVASSHTSDEIISNWLEITFVNADFQTAEFSSDYHWNERFFVLDYYEDIVATLRTSIDDRGQITGWLDPAEIRVVPYYRTANGIYYGHSFVAKLDGTKVSEELESTGDPFNDDTIAGDSSFQPVNKGDPIIIDGITPEENGTDDTYGGFNFENVMSNFFTMIKTLLNSAGQIPFLVSSVFNFLPNVFSSMIMTAIIICIILRVIGR